MPADTKPIDLAGLRVLLEKASATPWAVSPGRTTPMPGMCVANTGDGGCTWIIYGGGHRGMPESDAAAIVACVNAVPALLDRIEALEGAISDVLVNMDANRSSWPLGTELVARLRALLLPPEAPRAGEAVK